MNDHTSRHAPPGREYGRSFGPDQEYGEGRDRGPRAYSYSSARDYAAAGENIDRPARDHRAERLRGQDDYRGSYWSDGRRTTGQGRADAGYDYRDRNFLDRAGDEVRSWFGDEEAERRRDLDQRHAARHDQDYHHWRRDRIAELDRDYDEYRRENAQRFENEFNSWRTERQGQREGLGRVTEHMEVIGSDGAHVGTVDKVRGDRIVLTRSDPDAGGRHHSIPSRWIDSVSDKVTIRKSAEEAHAAWRDEERSSAFFDEGDERTPRNRAFSGTLA